MNVWRPWALVPITICILLLCAFIGWIIRLAQKPVAEAKSDWKTVGKIILAVICGLALAVGGCFAAFARSSKGTIGRTNYPAVLSTIIGGIGLTLFVAGIVWGTALGISYLIAAFKKRSNES